MIEIVRVEDADLQDIEGDRIRTFHAVSYPLTAEVILNDITQHQRRRVIVICNTVSQAQGIYRDLNIINDNITLKITLLHSRFLPEHRAKKEIEIQAHFSQNYKLNSDRHILIATQVIEAGLNITCEVMHTHLCPMNSLLQRAGRCARFRGEQGKVYVYRTIEISHDNSELATADLDTDAKEEPKKKQRFLPYDDHICELTWQVLNTHTQSEQVNQNVSFRIEGQWINQIHQQEDSLQAERRKNDWAEFTRRFHDAIFRGDKSTADELIRFVDSRSVFVWEEPIFIDDEPIDPKKLLAFSVPTSTLCKVLREVQNLGYEIDWIFKRIEYPKGKAAETYNQPVCTPIKSRNDLVNSIQILVNPRYVHYDEEIGLLIALDIEGNFSSPDKPEKRIKSEYRYRMDNYVGHLVLMWKCWREPFKTEQLINGKLHEIKYASVRDELLQAGGKFIQTKIFPEATAIAAENLFEYLVFFAIFTHDLGKLQVKWQNVMRGWQQIAHRDFGGRHPRTHLLAHTDYNPEDKQQRDALKVYETQHKRPNHAIESAFLAREILIQSLSPLLRDYFHADREQVTCILHTIIMAAGRHHSAWAKGWEMKDIHKLGKIQLHPDAGYAIASSWRSLVRFLPKTLLPTQPPQLSQNVYAPTEFELNKFSTSQIEYLQLYSLVVRALRLCDMRSVQG